jgi:hypothetical protein
MKTFNILMGAKMGDLFHSLIAPAYLYHKTGCKSNFYIAEACDKFETSLERSIEELTPIMAYQDYINSFEKFRNGIHKIDYDLNNFRFLGGVGRYHANVNFLRNLHDYCPINLPYNFQFLNAPKYDKYSDYLIVSRKPERTQWNDFVEKQYKHIFSQFDKKIFISFNGKDYEDFPLKNEVELLIVEELFEFIKIINSGKLFVANCSGPLCFASGLNINRVGEVGSWIIANYYKDHMFSDKSEIFSDEGVIFTPNTKYLLKDQS